MKTQADQNIDHWQDDVLRRREFSDFMCRVLVEQTTEMSTRHKRGLTVALDAGWGLGKTFFINCWALDLKSHGHAVVIFDAWKNDLGEEPSVALMATVKHAIETHMDSVTIQSKVASQINGAVREGVKELRRAILPASKIIAKSAIRKLTGVAVDEFLDAINSHDDGDNAVEDIRNDVESSLDKIFESSLAEQKNRVDSIEKFKDQISNALNLLSDKGGKKIPMFIFVDELDRCRPSYAISLLEEIKHIFGIPNVCFVVSTNIEQLSHSAKAIYGSEFDAFSYLKRFFEQTFSLPPPNNKNFADLLWQETTALKTRKVSHGLPRTNYDQKDVIALISDALSLDLRSQRQVLAIADRAAMAIGSERKIFFLWLFFLSALLHKRPEKYLELHSSEKKNQTLISILASGFYKDVKIPMTGVDDIGRNLAPTSVDLKEVLILFSTWSDLDLTEIQRQASSEYPRSTAYELCEELPSQRYINKSYPPSISNYLNAVKYAGYVSDSSAN